MKTHFNKLTPLVLTDDSNKVVALIIAPAGEADISAKVIKAIKEDMNAESVILPQSLDFKLIYQKMNFDAKVTDELGHMIQFDFFLTPVTEY